MRVSQFSNFLLTLNNFTIPLLPGEVPWNSTASVIIYYQRATFIQRLNPPPAPNVKALVIIISITDYWLYRQIGESVHLLCQHEFRLWQETYSTNLIFPKFPILTNHYSWIHTKVLSPSTRQNSFLLSQFLYALSIFGVYYVLCSALLSLLLALRKYGYVLKEILLRSSTNFTNM